MTQIQAFRIHSMPNQHDHQTFSATKLPYVALFYDPCLCLIANIFYVIAYLHLTSSACEWWKELTLKRTVPSWMYVRMWSGHIHL